VITEDGNPALVALGDSQDLHAQLVPSAKGTPSQAVKVFQAGQAIFETEAGLPSPVFPLQGLWTYDGHWALEILYADQSTWTGQIFIDGKLINTAEGYTDAFGLQLLAGRPFFFYQRDGQIGYWYDGKEVNLGYDAIPHYLCCSESTLNPWQAQDLVTFFAAKGPIWYFVELGIFNQ
jgi:hypothetical protein